MIDMHYDIARLLRAQYSNVDVVQEKPFSMRCGKNCEYLVAFPPVSWLRLTDLLGEIYMFLHVWSEFYDNLNFLSYLEIADEEKLQGLIDKVRIFTGNRQMKRMYRHLATLINRWGAVYRVSGNKIRKVRFTRRVVRRMSAEQLIIGLNALIVFNNEVPKKKLHQALRQFATQTMSSSSSGSWGDKVIPLPTWNELHASKRGS